MSYRQKKSLVLTIASLLVLAFIYACLTFSFFSGPALVLYGLNAVTWYFYFVRFLFVKGSTAGYQALYRYRPLLNLIYEWNSFGKILGVPYANLLGWPFLVLIYSIGFLSTLKSKRDNRFWLSINLKTDTIESITQSILAGIDNPSAKKEVPAELKLPSLQLAINRAREIISKDSNVQEVMIVDFGDFLIDKNGNEVNLQWIVRNNGEIVRTI